MQTLFGCSAVREMNIITELSQTHVFQTLALIYEQTQGILRNCSQTLHKCVSLWGIKILATCKKFKGKWLYVGQQLKKS